MGMPAFSRLWVVGEPVPSNFVLFFLSLGHALLVLPVHPSVGHLYHLPLQRWLRRFRNFLNFKFLPCPVETWRRPASEPPLASFMLLHLSRFTCNAARLQMCNTFLRSQSKNLGRDYHSHDERTLFFWPVFNGVVEGSTMMELLLTESR